MRILSGIVAVACVAVLAPTSAASVCASAAEPLIFNEDALHYPAYTADYVDETTDGKPNEMQGLSEVRLPRDFAFDKKGMVRWIDEIAHGHVTHYFMNVNFQRALFPSKTFEPIWVSLDDPTVQHHAHFKTLRDAYANGLDMFAVWIERCREKKISPWLSFRMNDIHGTQSPGNPNPCTFWKKHPEYHLSKENGWANGLNWQYRAVRDRMLAFIWESLERYDADGIELDLIRFPYYFPADKAVACSPIFTAFLRDVRAATEAAAAKRGHPVKIAARLLPTPDEARKMGFAVDAWAREKLVDAIIPCNMFASIDFDIPLDAWRDWTDGRVRVIAGADAGITENGVRRPARLDEYKRWAQAMHARGTHGLYLFNFFSFPLTNAVWKSVINEGLAKYALDDAFLDREITRTAPDYVVYRPFADDAHDDHGNEHFHVFHVRGALCALWTQSAFEGTFTQRPVFSRSMDGGKTWTKPKCILHDPIDPKTGRNMGSWAAAVVSKSGRIYVLYAKHLGDGTDHETGKMHVLCSDDLGETWSAEAPFAQPHDPRFDLDVPAKPVSLFPWQNAYRLSDGGVLMAFSHIYKNPAANPAPRTWWPEAPGGCEFARFDNVDDDPPPAELKATWFARGEKGLRAPLYTDPDRPSGEEPAVVELPDGRLMCAFRACEGHVWYSVSADRGETWRPCEMLRYRDGGAGVEHPYSPCPMFRIARGEYVLFTHNATGRRGGMRPRTDLNWRNPLYLLKGEFRPGAHQPVWFSEPKKIMDNGGVKITRMDLAMYADLTVEPEGPVFWYPDRKFFLLGKKLAPLLKDMRVPEASPPLN